MTTQNKPSSFYVSSVESDIKSQQRVKLGYRTIIMGPNGSGKSTIINAIEMAGTNQATDISGRAEVKDAGFMMSMSNSDTANIVLSYSNGMSAHWRTKRTREGTVKEPDWKSDLPVSFPVRAVELALTGSADKAREFLLNAATPTLKESEVISLLDAELVDEYKKQAKKYELMGVTGSLLRIWDDSYKNYLALNKEVNSLENEIIKVGASLGSIPSDEELDEQKILVDAMRTTWKAAIVAEGEKKTKESKSLLRWRLTELKSEHKKICEQLEAYTESLSPGVENSISTFEKVQEIRRLSGKDPCLACGNTSEANGYSDVINEWEFQITVHTKIWTHCQDLRKKKDSLGQEIRIAEQTLESLGPDTPDYRGISAKDAEESLKEAEKELTRLNDIRATSGQIHYLRESQKMRKKKADQAKLMSDRCGTIVTTLLDKSIVEFIQRVQRYLPPTDVFLIVLREGKKEVCKFGFARNQLDGTTKLHTALSGAEWARLMMAISMALAENQTGNMVRVFTSPDRAFDKVTLINVLHAIQNANGQVIFTTTFKLNPDEIPDGYTVIDLFPEEESKIQVQAKESVGVESEGNDLELPLTIESLRMLHYSVSQSERLLKNGPVAKYVIRNKIDADGYSVLKDGQLFKLPENGVNGYVVQIQDELMPLPGL